MAANHKGYIFSDPNSEIVLLMIQKTLFLQGKLWLPWPIFETQTSSLWSIIFSTLMYNDKLFWNILTFV